jgi:hypothetical protein
VTTRSRILVFLTAVAAGLLIVWMLGTRGGKTTPPDPAPLDATAMTIARERVAAFAAKDERTQAREALRPLVARKDAALEDLLRAAAIEFGDNRTDEARAYLDRAAKIAPDSPAVAFMRGQMAREEICRSWA